MGTVVAMAVAGTTTSMATKAAAISTPPAATATRAAGPYRDGKRIFTCGRERSNACDRPDSGRPVTVIDDGGASPVGRPAVLHCAKVRSALFFRNFLAHKRGEGKRSARAVTCHCWRRGADYILCRNQLISGGSSPAEAVRWRPTTSRSTTNTI